MALTAHSATYNNELFAAIPDCAYEYEIAFGDKPDKTYVMGRTREIYVEVYKGKGVVVTYPSIVLSFNWCDRNTAWDWARERTAHWNVMTSGESRRR